MGEAIRRDDPIENYRPGAETLESLRRVRLISVIGPTAVGKTSLLDTASGIDGRLHRVVPETSRPPRPGEQPGVDYNFSSKDEMLRAANAGKYVQIERIPTGHLYATRPSEFPPDKIAALPFVADAIGNLRELPFGEHQSVFLLPPSFAVWQERLHGRFADEQAAGRLAEARRSLAFGAEDGDLKYVVGEDLGRAAGDFIAIAHGYNLDERQQADQMRGHLLAAELLAELNSVYPETDAV